MTAVAAAMPAVLPALAGDDVHVWLADVTAIDHRPLRGLLSAEERARAARFVFDRDRVSYVCSHGVLRQLLGGYLGRDPRHLRLECGARGKPRLADGALAFNLSHSGAMAAIAVSRRGEIGVDIEGHRPLPDLEAIARATFSPGEVRRLQRLPPGARPAAFFTCWSRKEAYVKAVGDGLAHPLDAFDVTFAPGEPVRLEVPEDATPAARWTLAALAAPPGYAAALVTAGRRAVRTFAWAATRAEEIA